MCSRAKLLSLSWPIEDLRYVFSRLKTDTDLSHSAVVTGSVQNMRSTQLMFGYIVSSAYDKQSAGV